MDEKNVLLSVRDLSVRFRVRGRTLTAIRGISLDIYEGESIAIVGESGSGKSVFTKTFAGMLDDNGYIDRGEIIFHDEELADTRVRKSRMEEMLLSHIEKKLDAAAHLELGAETWCEMEALRAEKKAKQGLTEEEEHALSEKIEEARYRRAETYNRKQTYDGRNERDKIRAAGEEIAALDRRIKELAKSRAAAIAAHTAALKADAAYLAAYAEKMASLQTKYRAEIAGDITDEVVARNRLIAKEFYLSVGRYPLHKRIQLIHRLLVAMRDAMRQGLDLSDEEVRNRVFDAVVFRVRYLSEDDEMLVGSCVVNLAKVKYAKDWTQIRGRRIATVFQDPMTSLNPVITIGRQISAVIMKHQGCSEVEARRQALVLMKKVGIPNAENRYDDYPFQYSGGMRQRIVIAIALSCRPKILICDEPTTALDVTIQAQILRLIKDLQKEFGYTIVFITHDLGVVANIADRVAVLYAGQIVEVGRVDEVFYDPRHPYTWALLSSLPQLAERNTELYSIHGTPPSLYNEIVGDPFAPRNPYCLKVDTLKEPPMFRVTDTHSAKTWLLDPRAPHMEKPEIIQNIHEKLMRAYHIV